MLVLIEGMLLGRTTLVRLVQCSNAEGPISVTLSEITIRVRLEQCVNADSPIFIIPSEIIMLVKFTDNKVCFDEYFYYMGKVTPLTEEGKLYIKKQQQRCYKCMLSLENIQNKRDEYLYYKNIYNSITDYLENFGEK